MNNCVKRPKEEISADLNTINSALQELVSGRRVTNLSLGYGDFQRTYNFQEISYEVLQNRRAELLNELSAYSECEGLKFRSPVFVPIVVDKFF